MGPAEELVRIAKKLDKMVARKSTEGALDLLKSLTGYTMTIQLLQTTRIGVAVNSVRKHCSDEEVVASAKILIKNWKRLLGERCPGHLSWGVLVHWPPTHFSVGLWRVEKGAGWDRVPKVGAATSHLLPLAGMQLPECLGLINVLSALQSPLRRPRRRRRANSSKGRAEPLRTSASPSSPTACLLSRCYLTGDSVRDKCIEMLTAALRMDDDYKEFGVNCEKMASEIEEHILWDMPGGSLAEGEQGHHHSGGGLKSTDMKYRNRVRSRISNLKDPKNPNLRRNVLCGAIAPGLIARMTAEEMASDELKELRNAMTQEAIREHQMAKTGGTVTDLFQCGKCKKKNCTYNQVQTRSADEPMTTFVLCNECGNRWKVR
ncbi:TCEA3 protein, partial [Crypturellus undulatus]|nr:TCEA3 protein [Crypturellus undulatus]